MKKAQKKLKKTVQRASIKREEMKIRTIIALLQLGALSLQADPECVETEKEHALLQTICRSVPELQSLTGHFAYVPCDYREIAPGYYLLCIDIGSGAYVYNFALVKHNPTDNTWKLIDKNIISSSEPKKYIHHEVKDNQYKVEILLAPNDWVSVFTGTLSTPKPTAHE